MQIKLTWVDPNTGDRREPLLQIPVAIGKEFSAMPQQIDEQRVSRVTIQDDLVAGYHALINWQNQELIIIDQNTSNGMQINGLPLTTGSLSDGDRIQIGNCEIIINYTATTGAECDRMIGFLFKRRCGRTDTIDCAYCNQSYEEDYAYYSNYGNYRSSSWGSDYYSNRDRYSYDPETGNVDFTEADAMSLETERDGDFESNMGAS
ncbi:FHA domain-containing protein [Nostoc sp. UHCC 0870]|uniref:FHA domain-containing protein n=1 Tax=Nostoc sp. UHCC 0870 TaxID=2914041 RepID=UPI001EDCF55B|nr:FHA domain-containing protein [Nostoc sp. UHCC 0870]UKO97050.1 FHA domain-containing protein [Nostoc sp. UHCC 0870]